MRLGYFALTRACVNLFPFPLKYKVTSLVDGLTPQYLNTELSTFLAIALRFFMQFEVQKASLECFGATLPGVWW